MAKRIKMNSLVNTIDEEYHTPFFLADSNNYVNIVQLLLWEIADIEILNKKRSMPFNSVTAFDHEEVFRALLANRANK